MMNTLIEDVATTTCGHDVNKYSTEVFLESCGCTGPLELVVESRLNSEPMQRSLFQPFAVIGREPRSAVILNHPSVSRRHAYLQMVGGRLFCIDLASRTGTHWDTGPRRSGWVEYDEAIQIGPFWVRRKRGTASATATNGIKPISQMSQFDLPTVVLEFVNRSSRGATWQMAPLIALVGRAPECRVHLVGESVSNYHCSLVRTPVGVWILDLLGRGGIWVNDVVVRCALLEDGDRIQAGKFSIRVHYEYGPVGLEPSNPMQHEFSAAFWRQPEESAKVEEKETRQPPERVNPEIVVTGSTSSKVDSPASDSDGSWPTPSPPANLPAVQDVSAGLSESAQAIFLPIARQMGLMQQQMFDQFQQAMMMMFQMFHTLQRDQIGVIRQELDHLQRLSTELHTLQTELARRKTRPAKKAKAKDGAAPAQPAPASRPQSDAAMQAPVPPAPSAAASVPPVQTVAAVAPKPAPTAAPEQPHVSIVLPPITPIPDDFGPPEPENEQAFHLQLAQRIASIQEERQSRWQKVMSFLSGK